jgi:predicted DNA-binding transcriptional regulator AlpA
VTVDDDLALMTIPQVCRALGIGRSTWYSWQQRGHGPPIVPIGPPELRKKRLVRVRRADLLDWLEGRP